MDHGVRSKTVITNFTSRGGKLYAKGISGSKTT